MWVIVIIVLPYVDSEPKPTCQLLESIPDVLPSNIGLAEMSKKIRRWRLLAVYLKLDESEIQGIASNNSDFDEQKYEMLLKWKTSNGINATWKALAKACEAWGNHELIYRIAELCK